YPAGQRELQRDRDRDRDRDLPAGLTVGRPFPGRREAEAAARTGAWSCARAGAFRRRWPVLDLIQPVMQGTDALENQRAVGRRVTLAVARFRPVAADAAGLGVLVVLAG